MTFAPFELDTRTASSHVHKINFCSLLIIKKKVPPVGEEVTYSRIQISEK
jgi:hypothetical protein